MFSFRLIILCHTAAHCHCLKSYVSYTHKLPTTTEMTFFVFLSFSFSSCGWHDNSQSHRHHSSISCVWPSLTRGPQHYFGRTWKSGSHFVSGKQGQSGQVLFNEAGWLISHWLMIFSVIFMMQTHFPAWLRVVSIQKLSYLHALFHVERWTL